MTLNEKENGGFIVSHLATPLGLAYLLSVEYHNTDDALKNILTYIKYGGMPHNITYQPDYKELVRLLEFYSRDSNDEDGSANFDYCTTVIIRCIYNILLNTKDGKVTSDILRYYTEAKNCIEQLKPQDKSI